MDDLISRKALKSALRETLMQAHDRVDESDFDLLFECIEESPTAYDIDKVVGQLKKVSYERFGNDGMGGELVVNLDDAIEIVKAGGKDE